MSEKVKVIVKGERIPFFATKGAAGADICANISENVTIAPQEIKMIPTGLYFEIPEEYEIQVRPRSGLAAKHGVTVLNTPGTIDSDYRGEVRVILINHSQKEFVVEDGMRIAQIVTTKVSQVEFLSAEKLSTTARGAGGFGHTGVK